ncbi:MAG: TetR/AcrR family transcriptional regulator [Terriglobales bacterium]|jgi:AcrR family transcriptional regulator
MARQPDPDLEERILNAARQLWKKGADKALTMRAVARAARTNTPAVYRRFRHRDDILRALLQRTRQEFFRLIEASSSVAEAGERYLDFALSHPHEYELYYLNEHELLFSAKPARGLTLNQILKQERPSVELMKGKLAAQLGGSPDDYTRLELALWALLHGTAMLLIAKTIQPPHAAEMRSACLKSVETLLREASRLPRRK